MNMKARLFRSPFEQLNLFLPFVFLLFCLTEIFSGNRELWQYRDFMKYVQDLIFFNGLHVCLTFIFLASTVSGRNVLELFFVQTGKLGVLKVLIVFFGSVFIYYFVHTRYTNTDAGFILFYLALAAVRRKHDLGQSKGLLRIANRKFVFNYPEYNNDKLFQKIQSFEHHCINIFYFTSLMSIISYFDFGINFGTWERSIFLISFWSSMALAAIITICALNSPSDLRFWKTIYSARFYLKALGPYSAIAAYLGASVHGIEYVFVTDKILHSEQSENKLIPKVGSILVVISIILFGFAFIRYPELFLPSANTDSFVPLVSFSAGIIITHFYVDYLIFTPKHDYSKPLLKILSK